MISAAAHPPKVHPYDAAPASTGHATLPDATDTVFAQAAAPSTPIPKKLHWVWVGDKRMGEDALANILETARLAPGFTKTIWTNDPKLLERADWHTSARQNGDVDIAAALQRSGIRLKPIDGLLRKPLAGFSQTDLARLSSVVHRETHAPLANRASASDVLRLLALHREGGVYMDVDFNPHSMRDFAKTLDIFSPSAAEQRSATIASLKKSYFPDDSLKVDSANSERRALHAKLVDGALLDTPETTLGFAVIADPEIGFNNSIIAAAPGGTDAVIARALKMIVRQETHPLTLAQAKRLRCEAPELHVPISNKIFIPLAAAVQKRAAAALQRKLRAELGFTNTKAAFTAAQRANFNGRSAAKHVTMQLQILHLCGRVLRGKVDDSQLADALTALNAGKITAPYIQKPRFASREVRSGTADASLPLSWEAKRLRPRNQSEIEAVRTMLSGGQIPSTALTLSMTGPGLLMGAAMADPRVREAVGARPKCGRLLQTYLSVAAATAEATTYHPFFKKMPPCDNPSLRALRDIRYARDADV